MGVVLLTGEAVTKSLVEAAVNKGLRDLQENPARGIRNLVDLGAMFAGGRYQKEFFQLAQSELENEDSVYYRLVEKVVCNTSAQILKTFGMNLIYNCWNLGARKIRKKEQREHFNIPWTLIYEMGNWVQIDSKLIKSTITQGKKLGIYCYIFSVADKKDYLEQILPIMIAEQDAAFLLLLSPQLLTDKIIDDIIDATNIFVVLDNDESTNTQLCIDKSDILNHKHSLFGVSYSYHSLADWQNAKDLQDNVEKMGCSFLFLYEKEREHLCAPQVQETLSLWRRSLSSTVFPIVLYHDIAVIDKNISSAPSLVIVDEHGRLSIYTNEGGRYTSEQTLADSSLEQVLSAVKLI